MLQWMINQSRVVPTMLLLQEQSANEFDPTHFEIHSFGDQKQVHCLDQERINRQVRKFQLYRSSLMGDSQLQHRLVREIDPTHFDLDDFERLVRLHYRGEERMENRLQPKLRLQLSLQTENPKEHYQGHWKPRD